MVKSKKTIQRDDIDLNSDEEAPQIEELKEEVEVPKPKSKVGRKKMVDAGQVLTVEKEDQEPISFNKAKKLIKEQKPKYEPSEKQKANTARLIEANRLRREAKLEAKAKAEALEVAKSKQKKLVVLPKRTRTKKEPKVVETEVESDYQSSEEEVVKEKPKRERNRSERTSKSEGLKDRKQKIAKVYDNETDGDTTDTRTIKKKIEKVKMIDDTIKQTKYNMISKGFF